MNERRIACRRRHLLVILLIMNTIMTVGLHGLQLKIILSTISNNIRLNFSKFLPVNFRKFHNSHKSNSHNAKYSTITNRIVKI